MFKKQFSFSEFGFSSPVIRALIEAKDSVKPHVETFFSINNLEKQARKKIFTQKQRRVLVNQLKEQNKELHLSDKSAKNIENLALENAVTITTGHQLNLMTGPLYSIYKVAQVISLCKEMNKRDAAFKYIPVFWMATEDHDFEEINHLHLFGNKIEWTKTGQENHIVGEINPHNITEFTSQIEEKFNADEQKKVLLLFTNIYKESKNLAEATRRIMNVLFGEFGLVIIDGNDAELKKEFAAVAIKEIEEAFVYKAVSQTNENLKEKEFHSQVFVRNCNLFKIDSNGKRERIAKENGVFHIGEAEISKNNIINDIKNNPKQYSPNALLRPVYQELILPNIAYIGGGGEIAYWLQLKTVFNAIDLDFPLLRVRDSFVLLKEKEIADLEELKMSVFNLKEDVQHIIKRIALQDVEVEIELKNEIDQINQVKETLLEKANQIQKGLSGMIEAEFTKMRKAIEKIESKLIKAEKGKHDQKANKIKKLQNKIYPNGGFQERYENFLPYYLNDANFISKLIDNLPAEDQPLVRIIQL